MTHTVRFSFDLAARAFRDGLVILEGDIEVTYVCPVGSPRVEILALRRHGYDITGFFTPAERADFAKVIEAHIWEAAEGSHRRPLHEGFGVDRE